MAKFPSNPQVGDKFSLTNKTWVWNGTGWTLIPIPGPTGPTGPVGPTGPTGPTGPVWVALVFNTAYTSNLTLDASSHDIYDVVLSGNVTLNFINGTDGKIVRLRIKQDSIGGRTLTLGNSIRVGYDILGTTLSLEPNKMDYLAFQYYSPTDKYDFVSYVRGY